MANVVDQMRLLELQGLDNKLAELRHKKQTDPSIAAVKEIESRIVDLRGALVQANIAVTDADREVAKAQGFVTETQSHIAKNQKRIDGAELGHKDTLAVTEEMDALVTRVAKLEDDLLVVMERQEACQTAQRQLQDKLLEMEAALAAASKDRDEVMAAIMAEGKAVIAERDKVAAGLDPGLVKRYDTIRARSGGIAAVRLWGGKCEGCQMQLPPGDLDTIARVPADQVVTCEECGRILVRVPQ